MLKGAIVAVSVGMLVHVAACSETKPTDVGSSHNAITQEEAAQPEGIVDPPVSGAEPLPEGHEGPPLPQSAVDPVQERRHAQFETVLIRRLEAWKAAGDTEEQIHKKYSRLKWQMLAPLPLTEEPSPRPVGH